MPRRERFLYPDSFDFVLISGRISGIMNNKKTHFTVLYRTQEEGQERKMNSTIRALLAGQEENHILPFFWQHGEEEATLREMMAAIHGASCLAVCVESRPHPDFCGPRWWRDMDIILEEARSRGMKVWILDDSHFPTGFANGALKGKPDSLCRQGVFLNRRAQGPFWMG